MMNPMMMRPPMSASEEHPKDRCCSLLSESSLQDDGLRLPRCRPADVREREKCAVLKRRHDGLWPEPQSKWAQGAASLSAQRCSVVMRRFMSHVRYARCRCRRHAGLRAGSRERGRSGERSGAVRKSSCFAKASGAPGEDPKPHVSRESPRHHPWQ